MAATRTSTTSGDIDTGSTWIGGIAPVAGDSAIIANGHTVTCADNTPALLVAITINVGGHLMNNAVMSTPICGAVTCNGTFTNSANCFWFSKDGSFTQSATSTFNGLSGSTFQLQCTVDGAQGPTYIWTSTTGRIQLESCTIQGVVGDETNVIWNGASDYVRDNIHINNVLFRRLYRNGITNSGALCISNMNRYTRHQMYLGNISFEEITAPHNLFINGCIIESDTGTIDMTSATAAASGINSYATYFDGGTYSITSTSTGISISSSCRINGGTWTIITASSAIQATSMLQITGGTFTINSSGVGGGIGGGFLSIENATLNITTTNAGASAYAIGTTAYTRYGTGAVVNINCASQPLYLASTIYDGGTINIVTGTTATAFVSLTSNFKTGILRDSTGSQWTATIGLSGLTLQHRPTMQLINEGGSAPNVGAVMVEPTIIVNGEVAKTLKYDWNFCPWNVDDYTFTGVVDFSTTISRMTMASGATATLPKCQPWQVTAWGTITASKTGTPTYEYRTSTDGGTNWSGWTGILSGGVVGATPNGNGQDAIQFKVTATGGAAVMLQLYGVGSFDNIAYSYTNPVFLMPQGELLKKVNTTPEIYVKLEGN